MLNQLSIQLSLKGLSAPFGQITHICAPHYSIPLTTPVTKIDDKADDTGAVAS